MHARRLLTAALACLCVVVIVSGGGALGATSPGADGDIVLVRGGSIQFLTTPSLTSITTGTDPSWSPDGTTLAFSNGGAIDEVTCTGQSCGAPAQIGTAAGTQPVWRPDGNQLAYVSGGVIKLVTAGGSDVPLLPAVSGTHPTWSPDGTQLAFSDGTSVFTCTVSSCSTTTVSFASGSQPAWSPDGTTLAFTSGGSIDVKPVGGGTTNVVTTAGSSPAWSPDSDSIVYVTTGGAIAVAQGSGSSWSSTPRTSGIADTTPEWRTTIPSLSVAPSIFGSAQTGQSVSTSNGIWNGATSFTYQWRRCDSAGNNCADIGGATASTYAVVSADVGSRLRVVVTGKNAAGTTSSPGTSAATATVTQAGVVTPPSNTAYPVVTFGTGQTTPLVGSFISATAGSWSGSFPLTFTYQWKFCDSATSSCFNILGATSSFYTVPSTYYGKVLRVQVTATNSAASVSQNSEATPAVSAIAPKLRVTPPLTGQNVVGQTLGIGFGTWDGSPAPTFTYSWRRCNPAGDFASCVQIPGATAATYVPAVADIGFTIRVWITGTNIAGNDQGITNHTFPIVDKQHFSPANVVAPAIAGTMIVGRQLTASIGSFSGDTPVATAFVWQRCDATGVACRTIPGATKVVYYPTPFDQGFTLRLAVTAKNAYGTITTVSDASDPVVATPPHHRGRHIVGTAKGDYLAGGGFDDTILGMAGNDTLLGGAGDDTIDGGAGNDVITGGSGADTLKGGAGSDTIYAADGERDTIDCGPGRDKAVVDAVDIVKNCELVQTAAPAGSGSGSGGGTGTDPGTTPNPGAGQTP